MPRIRLSQTRIQPVGIPDRRLGSGWSVGINAMKEAAQDRYRADQSVIRAIDTTADAAARIGMLVERRHDRNEYAKERAERKAEAEAAKRERAAQRALAASDRASEKEANEAVTLWETAMLNGIEGSVGQDGKPQGGIAQTTWQNYEGTDRSPITDLGEIEKAFQASDAYKNLSGFAREKFKLKVSTRRAQYLGTVNRIYDRQKIARTQFYDAQADALGDRKVATAALADDEEFEGVAREETFRKMGRKFRGIMENPDVIDMPGAQPSWIKWKTKEAEIAFNEATLGSLRSLSLGRCDQMAKNAAAGEPAWVDGKLVTNTEQLAKARAYADDLAKEHFTKDGVKLPPRITPDERKALEYTFQQAGSVLDDRIRRTIAAKCSNVIAQGDLNTLEKAERELAETAKGFDAGSVGHTAALVAQQEVAKAADARATYEIMNDLNEGRRLTVPLPTPDNVTVEVPIFNPNTEARKLRLFPQVKAAWDRKVDAIRRSYGERNRILAEGEMLNCVAKGGPTQFYNYLARQVVDGKLTPKDFATLKIKFDSGWMSGFKGSPDQRSKQSVVAGEMIKAIKDKLGVDLSEAIKTDGYGYPTIKDGTVQYNDDVDVPSARVYRKTEDPTERMATFGIWSFNGSSKKEEVVSGEKIKEILGEALTLWRCDGMSLSVDPITGKKMPDGKPYVVNAAADFSALLDRICDERNVLSAAAELEARTKYITEIRSHLAADDQRRREMVAGVATSSGGADGEDETEERDNR